METVLQASEQTQRASGHETLLRVAVVMERTGKPRSSIYAGIADGSFPSPVKIGKRAVAWPSSSINAYIEGVIDAAARGSINVGASL